MSNLKSIANRLKSIEKSSKIPERENLIREVNEIIRAHEIQNPGFIQRMYWPLCELRHSEIRSMGRGEKSLESFKGRWKMSPQEWYDGRSRWREEDYLREIAEFNKAHGDSYSEWELNYGLKSDGETDSGNGKLQ